MLPSLTPEEERHSRALVSLIRERIAAAGGWISFEDFMDLALYAPGLGYYSAGSTKLGAGGDFVTAPEMSDLFSFCVARQCAEILAVTGGSILELGAGTGRMAAAMLELLEKQSALPEQYAILEVSADLRERQTATLSRLSADVRKRIVWLDRLPSEPLRGVVVANEVLDALPVRRFSVHGGELREIGVAIGEDGAFVESLREPDCTLAEAGAAILGGLPEPLPDGYQSEICLRLQPWLLSISECVEQGVLLFFDYGLPRSHYYHPQRTRGTLRCHFRQRAHDDPFLNVGMQDITAWVDFTRVAEAADAAGLEVSGFTTQAAFLLGTGIDSLAAAGSADAVERARLAGEMRRLLMPGEMGEAFKVMALGRGVDIPLSGFALQDLRHSL